MRLYTGTSGFAYKEWKGEFYPEDVKSHDMLAYYSRQLGAVEVNNTFYRMPKREVLEQWAETVGPGFQFVIKASRRITHNARLRSEADDSVAYLWRQLQCLKEKRGPVFFQCPPNMRADDQRLSRFLDRLPGEMDAAFEFRHESWRSDTVFSLLRERNCAWCVVETMEQPAEIVSTADWGYLRLRREDYDDRELAALAERVREQSWNRVYCFFKHEDVAHAPRFARRFGALFAAR